VRAFNIKFPATSFVDCKATPSANEPENAKIVVFVLTGTALHPVPELQVFVPEVELLVYVAPKVVCPTRTREQSRTEKNFAVRNFEDC
jgi:hypothetical protein